MTNDFMRLFRWLLMGVLLVILGMALYQTLLWLGVWGYANESQVKALDDDDQEIALIEPATNVDDWGRIVTALRLIERDWRTLNPALPALHVELAGAFPRLTAEVPEIVIGLGESAHRRLRLRWYKISGEHDADSWVRKLHARARAPLAVIGGGTSDRAVRLAGALQMIYPQAEQPSPVLLITTATAEKIDGDVPLIDVYPGRSFRFSFTNQKMVESLLQFAQHRRFGEGQSWARNLWVSRPADPAVLTGAVASMVGCGDFWHAWALFRSYPHLQPYTMHAVSWEDERYSKDMTQLFAQEFKKRNPLGEFFQEGSIRYGIGGFFHPSPLEQDTVGTFLARPTPVTPHSFLVLPTQTVRMRRFLINLRQRSPLDARNLVILNGDAIPFHAVYRDRDVIWNILDLPYSLVFFSHRNPIDHAAGFTWTPDDRAEAMDAFPQRTTTGTQDILLYRDLFEALLYAASDHGEPITDPLRVRQRLRATCWRLPPPGAAATESPRVCNPEVHGDPGQHRPFFDDDGNRRSHTGEHIVWVKPNFYEERVDLTGKISVWTIRPDRDDGAWSLVEAVDASYNQSQQEAVP